MSNNSIKWKTKTLYPATPFLKKTNPTTTYMTIKGFHEYGMDSLARALTLNHIECVYRVFKSTGNPMWENYTMIPFMAASRGAIEIPLHTGGVAFFSISGRLFHTIRAPGSTVARIPDALRFRGVVYVRFLQVV